VKVVVVVDSGGNLDEDEGVVVVSESGDVAMLWLEAESLGRWAGTALVLADGGLEGRDAGVIYCGLFDGLEMVSRRRGLRYAVVPIGIVYWVT
jgi:hypothetical protein